jgi:hypothetical protein
VCLGASRESRDFSLHVSQWFTTLFAPCITGATCCCVLDLLLAGCDNVLFRFGAAILVLLETHLIVMSTEELMMARHTVAVHPLRVALLTAVVLFGVDRVSSSSPGELITQRWC